MKDFLKIDNYLGWPQFLSLQNIDRLDPAFRRQFADSMPPSDLYKRALSPVWNRVKKDKSRELMRWLQQNYKIYDVGAGCGQLTQELQNHGYDVVAVEPDSRYTDKLLTVDSLTEKRHYAYLVNVLHHLEDPVDFLKALHRVTQRLIVSELNRFNPFVRIYVKVRFPWEDIRAHFSRCDVRRMIELSGWKINHSYSTSLFGVPRTYNWFVCESLN